MPIGYNKIEVLVRLGRIRSNFRLLEAKGGRVMPVVKADAYGHGLWPVARALAEEGARTFAVGTVEEAADLRRAGCRAGIVSLLGPLDPWEYEALWEFGAIPMIGEFGRLEELARVASRMPGPLDIGLKFDTGMSRLGFSEADLPGLLDRISGLAGLRPVMVSSHLAAADVPDLAGFLDGQVQTFRRVVSAFKARGLEVEANLANSAAVMARPDLAFQGQRPGVSLYGANPFWGTDLAELGQGLEPAMEVSAPVIEVRDVARGQSVGYGCTHRVEENTRLAVVAAGYADGYSRGLSNRGWALVRGVRVPVVGRVCMQLLMLDVGRAPGVEPGDRAWLLGGDGPQAIRPEELAEWWGTIPYEVFCLLGLNRKKYV
ncbi:MAG: alanine racemase [Desulfovibrionaceae bacterium]|nr:alanine racemase [Desulfovibrionaceae bacterium]